MTDEEFKLTVLTDLNMLKQELKGFNGTPGLCKRVNNLEVIVKRIVYTLCFVGGGSGLVAGISKLLGS